MQRFYATNMLPWTNPLASYLELKPEIDVAVQRVLQSGQYISGHEVEAFEQAWASYCGASYAIGVSSGTDTLRVALLACGIGPRDEVITVAHTAVATVAAIASIGAVPVMIDVDYRTWTMDCMQIEPAITEKTKAIIPVHLYGNPTHMEVLLRIAKKYNLRVIEDCAQAHGAKLLGMHVGTLGDAGAFSHYPTKNLGAMGDAGSIITNDSAIALRARRIRQYGTDDNRVSHILGFNARMDEIQAAVLLVKLPYLDGWNDRRCKIAQTYYRALCDRFDFQVTHGQSAHHLLVVRTMKRDKLAEHLKYRGIATSIHYPIPVHLQAPYHSGQRLPITEQLCKEIITLPLYPQMTDGEVEQVIDACLDFKA